MRRFDKNKNMSKANLLAEQRYLESKGILKEESFVDDNGELQLSDNSQPRIRKDLMGKPYLDSVGYGRLPELPIVYAVEFISEGTFDSNYKASAYLKDMGYSIGSMERDNPIGFSDEFDSISKWGNMNHEEHQKLDGVMISNDWREGNAIVMFFNPPNL